MGCELADQRDFFAGLQRQDVPLVFEQDNTFRRGAAGKLAVGVPIERIRRRGKGFASGKHQLQQFLHPRVKLRLGQFACFDRFQQSAGRA